MSRPRVGVLALQGDVVEHERALVAAGAEPVRVRRLSELESVAGLILPGGESTTIGKLLVAFDLLEPLQERVATGFPVFGSCAGMILLADTVIDGTADQVSIGGMDISVRRNAFGRQVESFERTLDVVGIDGGPLTAVFIRAPWVERIGPDVEVLATVEGHPVAVRQGRMLATSFHPEVTDDNRMHALFVDMAAFPSAPASGLSAAHPSQFPSQRTIQTTGETRA